MNSTALIIKCNDNPMAVTLLSKTFADTALIALRKKHFEEIKNTPAIQTSLENYKKCWKWTVQEVKLITQTTLPKPAQPTPTRTHVPETFPHPGHQKLPSQAQLPRKQLTAEKPPVREPTAVVAATLPENPIAVGTKIHQEMSQLEFERDGEIFIAYNKLANSNIVGRGPTKDAAVADYFRAFSKEKAGM